VNKPPAYFPDLSIFGGGSVSKQSICIVLMNYATVL
jgi:hypothetical protein